MSRSRDVRDLLIVYSNADSVVDTGENLKFVKPLEVEEQFDTFLDSITAQERASDLRSPVKYSQGRKLSS